MSTGAGGRGPGVRGRGPEALDREPGTGDREWRPSFDGAARRPVFAEAVSRGTGAPSLSARSPLPGPRSLVPGPRSPRTARGFTLIEVLLATVLLAAGLALAFASLRAAIATAERGEDIAQRSERVRAVEGFLRRRIGGARPIAFAIDPDSGLQHRFLGEERRMRFVADLPDYLGRGGPYLHELAVEDAGDGVRLNLGLTMVQAGVAVPERPPRPPELLADGLRAVRFRYRALTPENRLGEWQDTWEDAERLPLQVQVLLRDADGRDWPPMVIALPLANGYAAMAGGMP